MFEIFKEPQKRGRGEVPWGFDLDPADSTRILPDHRLLEILEQGLRYRIDGHSVRRVAAWIESRAGRPFHYSLVDRRLERERRAFRSRQRALPRLSEA